MANQKTRLPDTKTEAPGDFLEEFQEVRTSEIVPFEDPDPWDIAGTTPEQRNLAQDQAIEDLLQVPPGQLQASYSEAPADDLIRSPADESAAEPMKNPNHADPNSEMHMEEFKPTDQEWENVRQLEFPQLDPDPLESKTHPLHKLVILERDADGLEGAGDWREVTSEMP